MGTSEVGTRVARYVYTRAVGGRIGVEHSVEGEQKGDARRTLTCGESWDSVLWRERCLMVGFGRWTAG
jgi:hypothetical protein